MTAGPFEVRITVERRDPDGIAGTVLSEVALTGDDVRALLIAANHAASASLTWHPVTRPPTRPRIEERHLPSTCTCGSRLGPCFDLAAARAAGREARP